MIPGLRIESHSEVPVYRQIADGIRLAASEGRLPGLRLPATRDLSRQLGVNRNTVIAAYDLLASEGLVRSHTGRGTYLVADAGAAPAAPARDAWFRAFSRAVEGPGVGGLLSVYRVAISGEGISFAGSYPARDLMPVPEFSHAVESVLREAGAEVLSYGPTAGHPLLRESIAEDMRRQGSRVAPEGILVTNGSQQGLDLVFRALLDPGDAVVVEDPTYTGALSVLHSLGARLVGVPLDDEGIRTDLLARALERHHPRVLYVQPTFHNPTTVVMPEARRREVLALAARHRCAVVEDDWAGGDLHFEGAGLPTLHALDGGEHVIYVSTFSKKLLPGLRVGWVAAPEPVLERLVTLKQIEDCGTSPLIQAALERFVRDGGLEEHLRNVRPAYRERRDRMIEALERHAPEMSWTRPAGGLFLWVTLPEGLDSSDLQTAARERGVLFSKGDLFHVEGGGRRTLRLTYAAVSPDRIETGIRVLGDLVREKLPHRNRAAAEPAAEAVPIL